MNKKGFTLIELLAVIAIIAIIGAIATPNVIKLITSSNQEDILSDAKLAISKAKYKFRVDMDESPNGASYNVADLIESDNDYGNSYVQVELVDGQYIYKIYISNGKYCIGGPSDLVTESTILDNGKGSVSDQCS